MVGFTGCPVLPGLPDELDAERFSAAPNHLALAPRSRVAREREPQPARQRAGIFHRELRTGRGHIAYHALTCREAAVEGNPPRLVQRFARFALLLAGHRFAFCGKCSRYFITLR